MKHDFSIGRKFKPQELILYINCIKLVKESYPYCFDIEPLIRDCYEDNRDPDMRSLEEIETDSKIK